MTKKQTAFRKALQCVDRIADTVRWTGVSCRVRNRIEQNLQGLLRYMEIVVPKSVSDFSSGTHFEKLQAGKPMQLLLGLDCPSEKKSRKSLSTKVQEWVLKVSVHPR